MTLLGNHRVRIKKEVVTHIFRTLAGSGQITAQVGQEVKPADILGRSEIAGGFREIDLVELLGVKPQEVKKYLRRALSQKIYRGELLAFKKKGLFSPPKIITSPSDGVLDTFNEATGQLILKFLPQVVDLPAAVFGVIDAIDADNRRVVIRCQVSEIWGIFGSGKIREGILKILSRADLISTRQILPQYAEHIIVAGSLIYKDAILSAISKGVSGIITGGINAKDYRAMAGGRVIFPRPMGSDIGIGALILEGFGSLPIGWDFFEVLKKYEGRFAILDGNAGVLSLPSFEGSSIDQVKKVSLPPESTKVMAEEEVQSIELTNGLYTRVIAPPFMGEQGVVASLDRSPSLLPSGISTYLVNIKTRTRMIRMPYTNVEIV